MKIIPQTNRPRIQSRFDWEKVIALLSMLTLAYLFVFLSQLGGIR